MVSLGESSRTGAGVVLAAGLVYVEYANGVLMTVDCSWSKPLAYPMTR